MLRWRKAKEKQYNYEYTEQGRCSRRLTGCSRRLTTAQGGPAQQGASAGVGLEGSTAVARLLHFYNEETSAYYVS